MSNPATPAPAPAPAPAPDPAAPAPAPAPSPAADPAAPAPSPAPAPAAPENLLATPAPAVPPASDLRPPTSDLPAPTSDPAVVQAFATAITPVIEPLPDGSQMPVDSEALAQVAQVFARHGVPEAAAREVVAAYAAHTRQRFADAQASEAKLNAQMVAECRQAFGADLPAYLSAARKGGEDIFGADLFRQLASVEAFANDHRILRALAARGRAVTTDPAPSGAGSPSDERDLAARLYGPASAGK